MAYLLMLMTLLTLIKSGSCFYIQPDVIDFTSTPKSQVLLENSTLILECSIDIHLLDSSIPLPLIKWQYNNHDLDMCTNSAVMHYEGSSEILSVCEIESVTALDTGWYRCAAVDGSTNCTSQCYTTITVSSAAYVHILEEFSNPAELILITSTCSTFHLLPFKLPYVNGETLINVNFNIAWEKNGNPVSNIPEMETLPSGTLLIFNTSALTEGIYTSTTTTNGSDGGSIVLMRYKVQLNESSASSEGNIRLTLIHSYSDSVHSESSYILGTDHHLELICHVTSICSSTLVSWTYNDDIINNERHWLRYDTAISSGKYCCSKDGMSSCVIIADKDIVIGNDSTTYLKIPTENEVDDILLNCSTDNDIHWYYNGGDVLSASPTYSIMVSSSNYTNVIGIYQCVLVNSSISAIHTFRILPYGLTNPPSSVSLLIFPLSSDHPHGSYTVLCSQPLYTGGLNDTQLLYQVVITTFNVKDNDDTLPSTCTTKLYSQCNIVCTQLYFSDDDGGYRVFQLQVVDSGGNPISQLSAGETISTKECDVYSPAVPSVSLTCTTNLTSLTWQKDNENAYIPQSEQTVTNFICLSGNITVEEYPSKTSPPSIANGSIQITETLAVGDICSYTAYGLRAGEPSCTGSKNIGSCTVSRIIMSTRYDIPTESSTLILRELSSFLFIDEGVSFTTGHIHIVPLPSITAATSTYTPSSVVTTAQTLSTMTSNSSSTQPSFTLSLTNTAMVSPSSLSLQSQSSTATVPVTQNDVSTLIISVSVGLGIVLIFLLATLIVCIGNNLLNKSRNNSIETSLSFDAVNERDMTNLHIEVDVISYITTIEGLINNYDSDHPIATDSASDLVTKETGSADKVESQHLMVEEGSVQPSKMDTNITPTDNSTVCSEPASDIIVEGQQTLYDGITSNQHEVTTVLCDSGSDLSHRTASSSAYITLSDDTSSGQFSLPSSNSSEDYIGLPLAGSISTTSTCYPRHLRVTYSKPQTADIEMNALTHNFPTILEQVEEDGMSWCDTDEQAESAGSISIHSEDERSFEIMTTVKLLEN